MLSPSLIKNALNAASSLSLMFIVYDIKACVFRPFLKTDAVKNESPLSSPGGLTHDANIQDSMSTYSLDLPQMGII